MRRIILSLLALVALTAYAQTPFEPWLAGSVVTAEQVAHYGEDRCFAICSIDSKLFSRMKGKSYKSECTIPLSELKYIKALHITLDGDIKLG